MDPIIQDLEIEVLRAQSPYDKISIEYLRNFFNHYGYYPSIKAANALLTAKEELKHKKNIFFIDSYHYEISTMESGFIGSETKACKASTLFAETLQHTLNLKDHHQTNVVIGFVNDDCIHYDIIQKTYNKIISVTSS